MNASRPALSASSFLIGLASLLGLTACEENLETLAPIDGIFAINGFLDAASDTQWVRVTPIRTTILTTPDPVDAVVTLEHLGTGRIVELNPSVFTFPSPNFPGEAAYGHNFWTDEPIEREATYRLVARRSDGESSSAVVKIPRGLIDTTVWVGSEFDVLEFNGQVISVPAPEVRVRFDLPPGDHLAYVNLEEHTRYPYECSIPSGNEVYPIIAPRPAGPVAFEIRLVRADGLGGMPPPCNNPDFIRWTARPVISGERWPHSPGKYVGYLQQGSNIENGTGYLGGVAWERIPAPKCALIGPGAPQICEMFFGPETVTLDVLVRDPERSVISLRHIRLTRAGESWSRFPDLTMAYPLTIARFPGLLAGEYRITVPEIEQTGSPGITTYCEERTVVLSASEHRSVEIQTILKSHLPEPINANGCREG